MNLEGGCACGALRYRLTADPLRSFTPVIAGLSTSDWQCICNQHLDREKICRGWRRRAEVFQAYRRQRKGTRVFFCDRCGTYLWSKYYASPGDTLLVRVGTLDHPETIQPDVHIFTRSKLPWLELPKDVPAFESFYNINAFWSPQSKARLRRNVAEQG